MDIQAKPFIRFISAKKLMERWGIDFVELRQIPIPAFIQTKDMDYSRLNPYSKNCGKGPDLFGAIKKVSPVTSDDFNHVMYDIYGIELYEHLHPEILPGHVSAIPDGAKAAEGDPTKHDYSQRSAAEMKELAKRWKAEGQSRYQIALKLFPHLVDRIRKGSLKKKVSRLLNS
jgi:hypothetical protein